MARKFRRDIEMSGVVLRSLNLSLFLPGIPFGRVKEVAAGEECVQVQFYEIAHGLEGGAFHLYRDAAVRFMFFEVIDGFPIERVGSPCPAFHVRDSVFLHEPGDDVRIPDCDIIRCRRVVVGCALIPIGLGGHHDLSVGDFPVQAARRRRLSSNVR